MNNLKCGGCTGASVTGKTLSGRQCFCNSNTAEITQRDRQLLEDVATGILAGPLPTQTTRSLWEIAAIAVKSLDEARARVEMNQREHDLVRQLRDTLYDEDLISDKEYAFLASEKGATERLADYDKLRQQLDAILQSAGYQPRSSAVGKLNLPPKKV